MSKCHGRVIVIFVSDERVFVSVVQGYHSCIVPDMLVHRENAKEGEIN
jgi:hypothetical protein